MYFFQGDAELDPDMHYPLPLQGKTSRPAGGGRGAGGSQLLQVSLATEGHLAQGHALLGSLHALKEQEDNIKDWSTGSNSGNPHGQSLPQSSRWEVVQQFLLS